MENAHSSLYAHTLKALSAAGTEFFSQNNSPTPSIHTTINIFQTHAFSCTSAGTLMMMMLPPVSSNLIYTQSLSMRWIFFSASFSPSNGLAHTTQTCYGFCAFVPRASTEYVWYELALSIMELVHTKNSTHPQQLAVICGARALLPPLLLRQMWFFNLKLCACTTFRRRDNDYTGS